MNLRPTTISLLLVTLALLAQPLLGGTAWAQASLSSTAQLRQACETSLNNRVVITSSTEISQGATLPTYEQVATGCTIVLGPSASLEFDSVAMRFAGPLRIESATTTMLTLEKSNVYATAIIVAMPAAASAVLMKEANLNATSGDLSVTMGSDARLEMAGANFAFPRMLEASGFVRLTADARFSAALADGGFYGVRGLVITLRGAESVFKADEWQLWSQNGRTVLNTSGTKTLVELGRGNYYGYRGASITMTGAESGLIVTNRNFNTYTGTGVAIDVGGSAPLGMIKLDQARFGGAGGVTIRASVGSSQGMIELVNGSIGVVPSFTEVVIESGAAGSTLVKDSVLRSAGLARIASGSGGSCLAESNTIVAATQQICP